MSYRTVPVALALALTAACGTGPDHKPATTSTSNSVPASTSTVLTWPVPQTVSRVIDGDTVETDLGDTVRLLGIDTPERGQCGYQEATDHLAALVQDQPVFLTSSTDGTDADRYGRLLRYVNLAYGNLGDTDAGLEQIKAGLAIARYDSRDGYGRHDREVRYIDADAATPQLCPTSTTASPPASAASGFASCAEARAAGAAPLHTGDPGYSTSLDRDRDGTACE